MVARPNIFVFLTDQQRWDSCGCYGQRLPITPNLDELAAKGIRFENTFTCQPVCGPVRASIQTGVYPTAVNCHVNRLMLPIDADTVAKRMKKSGYHCGYLGKWHLASFGPRGGDDDLSVSAVPPERRGGWDHYWLAADCLEFTSTGYGGHMFRADGTKREFDGETYRVDALTEWTLEYMDTLPTDKPWFTFVSYIEPHHQNTSSHFEGPHGSKEKWCDYDVPGDLADTVGDWRDEYPDYLGCCNALDLALGRVVGKLKSKGLLQNTLLLFTSDHGCHFRTRNAEYKRSCHDSSVRIPMVACGPGFLGGKVCSYMSSNIDLPGTCLKAAGLIVPDHFHGVALQDVLSGSAVREEFLIQISEDHCGRALRTPRWTYSVRAEGRPWSCTSMSPSCDTYFEDCLYDNEADPHQRNNLATDPSFENVRNELRGRLLAQIQRVEAEQPIIEPGPVPSTVMHALGRSCDPCWIL